MQDAYVGDIGDYGKYGLLKSLINEKFSMGINWYYVIPENPKPGDGKHTAYLQDTKKPYKDCDPKLFDCLKELVFERCERNIEAIQKSGELQASFFGDKIETNRDAWHRKALKALPVTDIVFLDPDNGLQTKKMHETGTITQKHVAWEELSDYYRRGQTVVLYQHRPQMTSKEACVSNVMDFGKNWLKADALFVLEYPAFTNRFYFIFAHSNHKKRLNKICDEITEKWSLLGVKRCY